MKLPSLRRRWRLLAGGLSVALAGGLGAGLLMPAAAFAGAWSCRTPYQCHRESDHRTRQRPVDHGQRHDRRAGLFDVAGHLCTPVRGSMTTPVGSRAAQLCRRPVVGRRMTGGGRARCGHQTSISLTFHTGTGDDDVDRRTPWAPVRTRCSATRLTRATSSCSTKPASTVSPFFFTAPLTFFGTPSTPTGWRRLRGTARRPCRGTRYPPRTPGTARSTSTR